MRARSRWMLLGAYGLIVWGCIEALEARLRGSVELPCELQSRTHPIEQLRVYWQRKISGRDVFVVGVDKGILTTENQDEKYRGRASLNPSRARNWDFTLRLDDLMLMDSGTYDCYVWAVTSNVILQRNITELHITAEYTVPVITRAEPTEGSTELTLTCTTEGGSRHPEIRWINASDGTPIHEHQIHNNIYEDKEFINVTSMITINVTSTTNLSCVILTASGNLTSNYMLEVIGENNETERQHYAAPTVRNSVIVVVVLLTFTALVGIAVLKRRSFFSRGSSRDIDYQHGTAEIGEKIEIKLM